MDLSRKGTELYNSEEYLNAVEVARGYSVTVFKYSKLESNTLSGENNRSEDH